MDVSDFVFYVQTFAMLYLLFELLYIPGASTFIPLLGISLLVLWMYFGPDMYYSLAWDTIGFAAGPFLSMYYILHDALYPGRFPPRSRVPLYLAGYFFLLFLYFCSNLTIRETLVHTSVGTLLAIVLFAIPT